MAQAASSAATIRRGIPAEDWSDEGVAVSRCFFRGIDLLQASRLMMQVRIYCRAAQPDAGERQLTNRSGPGTQHFQRSLDAFLLRVLATAFRVRPIETIETALHIRGKLLGVIARVSR
jgi:hypothetical protein